MANLTARSDAMRVPVSERQAVLDELVLQTGGYPEEELNGVLWIESGWDPSVTNPASGATGLIQFMPFVLRRWGMSRNQVRQMSAAQQAPLVGRFFREANVFGKYKVPGDTYLAVAAPSFVGRADSAVVYKRGSKAWRQNKAWRPPGGGDITAGSIRRVLLNWLAHKPSRIENDGPPNPPRAARPTPFRPLGLGWGLVVLAAVALATDNRRRR